jgi:hypothetical protein
MCDPVCNGRDDLLAFLKINWGSVSKNVPYL